MNNGSQEHVLFKLQTPFLEQELGHVEETNGSETQMICRIVHLMSRLCERRFMTVMLGKAAALAALLLSADRMIRAGIPKCWIIGSPIPNWLNSITAGIGTHNGSHCFIRTGRLIY